MKHSLIVVAASLFFPLCSYAQSTGIGINTTSPDRPLTIQPSGSSGFELLSFKNGAGATKYHINFQNGALNIAETGISDYRLLFQPGGNIGIGTGAPSQQLELAGRAAPALLLHSNGNQLVTGSMLQFRESDVTYGWNLRHNSGGSEGGSTNDRLVLERIQGPSGTAAVMTWDQVTGSVGIGTSAPYSQLSNTNSNIIGSDGNGGNPGSFAWSANQQGYAGMLYNAGTSAASNGLAVKVASGSVLAALDVSVGNSQTAAGTSLLRVTGAGRVGIGTASPTQALDVAGTIQAQQLAYATAQVKYLAIPLDAFESTVPASYTLNKFPQTVNSITATPTSYLQGGTTGQAGYISAPVNLPQGAVITNISLIAIDNDGTSISPQVTLTALSPTSNSGNGVGLIYSQQATFTTESANWQTVSATANHIVQNDQAMYKVVVRLSQNSSGTQFFGVRLTYSITNPD